MATLAPEEQEQLDLLKQWWQRHGNLVSGVVAVLLLAYAAWTAWGWWQRGQSGKAAVLFDEMQVAAQANDVDRTQRMFSDLRDRFPRTVYAEQAGLLAAKVAYGKSKPDAAREALAWVAAHAAENDYQAIAHLRLAGVLLDQKQPDAALKELDAVSGDAYKALADDRRGDVLMAQRKTDAAKVAYERAWKAMDAALQYRQVVEAKLNALGVSVDVAAGAASAASAGARS